MAAKKGSSAKSPPHPVVKKGASVKIPMHSIMDILDAIDEMGHSKKFKAAAKKSKAVVTVHADTVNFVKGYMHKNTLHEQHRVAAKVVGACPTAYDCPYRQR